MYNDRCNIAKHAQFVVCYALPVIVGCMCLRNSSRQFYISYAHMEGSPDMPHCGTQYKFVADRKYEGQ